jgi:hypothetical protein
MKECGYLFNVRSISDPSILSICDIEKNHLSFDDGKIFADVA